MDSQKGSTTERFIELSNFSACSAKAVERFDKLQLWMRANLPGFVDLHIVYSQKFSLIEFSDHITALGGYRILQDKPEEWLWLILDGKRKRLNARILSVRDALEFTTPLQLSAPGILRPNMYGVTGLHFVDEFVDIAEENQLLNFVDSLPMTAVKTRFVTHFGHNYEYGTFTTSDNSSNPIPDLLHMLILERLQRYQLITSEFNQITIQRYPSGAGISPHIDSTSAFGDTILILSLKAAVMMEFHQQSSDITHSIELWPRSLLCIQDEARYRWTHRIRNRQTDLLSVSGQKLLVQRSERISISVRNAIQSNPGYIIYDE